MLREGLRSLADQACAVQQGTIDMANQESSEPVAAHITPLDDRGQLGPSTRVEVNTMDGRDISFHHHLPLSTRRAFVSVEDDILGSWEALVDLSWCRFNRMGHYTSGGRLVRPVHDTA